ncbi:esterase-like activity of phytase family protein [Aestuariibius sp. 2305UL40-4]|uniref:esterase-like activity of phytase family protein n=1 Tax=Aestuariibius violaceus TaxID=3234132 RepID=UPI00398ED698
MHRKEPQVTICRISTASVFALIAGASSAAAQDTAFNRLASFPVPANTPDGGDASREMSSEIIDATADGMTLVYTDSPLGALGIIDITDPSAPQPGGIIDLDGEPTSVAVVGGIANVAVNTSESYTEPSGYIASINIADRSEADRCDLGGQPDSVAKAPDGSFLAIAIENERDEDLGDGRTGQMPAGALAIVDLTGEGLLNCDTLQMVDLTGLAEVSPEDPEPEFVDINTEGEIVVSLQENNHIVVVSAEGEVLSHFSAGAVTLENVDTEEEGALRFTETLEDVVREPDAVKWIDDTHFATANEGDMDGGSRGWTVFSQDGEVIYDSGMSFEHAVIAAGHYPEERSGNKGVEPESIETATFGDTPMVFVGAERSSIVGVYDITDPATPALAQLLPSGIGPEGFVAIPDRNLLVVANEVDLGPDGGVRSHVMIFEYGQGTPAYPMLTSEGLEENGAPVGWGAISGMAAGNDGTIYAVNDSFYAMQPTIFVIDPSESPARITDAIRITRNGAPAQKLDLEGIALDNDGGFWLASEGRTDRLVPHAIYRVDGNGEIIEEIGLPEALMDNEIRFGFEGITVADGRLYLAIQREWQDDPENHVKIVSMDIETGDFLVAHYPKSPAETGWVGLSEITHYDGHLYFIERDNQIGNAAQIKKITRAPLDPAMFVPVGEEPQVLAVEDVRDLMPDLLQLNGYIQDKVEGLAILGDGTAWLSTDNDGVDDHSGETLFFSIGQIAN